MNAKQSLREASKHIEQLEDFNRRASAEIKSLNRAIDSVIAGQMSWCDWCEEKEECQRECKGHGCEEWWLAMNPNDRPELADYLQEGGEAVDESERFLSASPDCGS